MIELKDNLPVDSAYHDNSLIKKLANKTLKHLEEHENLIIFPPTIRDSLDLEDDQFIFESRNRNLNASNVVGILKEDDNEIKITSRFYNSGRDDYLLLRKLSEGWIVKLNEGAS